MNASHLHAGMRQNAILIAVFVALIAFSVYRCNVAAPPLLRQTTDQRAAPSQSATATQPVVDSADPPSQASEVEKTIATIREHQQKFDANPQSEDAPGLLSAMGNLYYQRMSSYKEAARCYDLLIVSYPNWPGIKPAYHQLATCYQRLGDRENEQRVYKMMMKAFPEDSQEYLYAKTQLGL
ncbi:MAG: hypothetical protein HZB26_09780 [Candidatus Hydrogenedentes bacterium]|nr:hypothetical protein [Candidatus Hydrogenedentota bacterium]